MQAGTWMRRAHALCEIGGSATDTPSMKKHVYLTVQRERRAISMPEPGTKIASHNCHIEGCSIVRVEQYRKTIISRDSRPKISRPAEFGVGKDRAHQALSRIERCWESGKSCLSRNIEQQSLPTTALPPRPSLYHSALPPSSPSFPPPHTALVVDEVLPQCCPVSRPGLPPRPEL